MKDKEMLSNSERLEALEQENKDLRKQLSTLARKEEDIYSYRIFAEARKKFLTWIGVVIFIITAFGVVSAIKIIEDIKDEVKRRGIEGIVEEIKQDFEEKHKVDIIQGAIVRLTPSIEGKVEEIVRTEILAKFNKAQEIRGPEQKITLVQALKESYADELYFVIAGSSTRPSDLEEEKLRVETVIGDQFDKLFPHVGIYPPRKGNRNYALVIDANLTFDKAKEIQKQAIANGFREDTFLLGASRAYFEYKK